MSDLSEELRLAEKRVTDAHREVQYAVQALAKVRTRHAAAETSQPAQ